MILYFKQAWNLIKQEKLFSSIYIFGTGLSITVVMVLSIVFYIRIANIYPETNRDRMLIAKSGTLVDVSNNDMSAASLSLKTIETCFRSLQNAEAVSAIYKPWGGSHYIQPAGSKEQIPVTVNYIDNDFWKVFSFRFLSGAPFTEADFQSGIHTVVISESTAKRYLGTVDAVGMYISLNFLQYRVCGVVKDVSFVTPVTYAQLWIPYTVNPEYKMSFAEDLLGFFRLYILASSAGDIGKIKEEVLENLRKLNNTIPDNYELRLQGQPDRHWESTFRFWSNDFPDFNKILLQYSLIFLILLLVPGISLSSMIDSRMERRLPEMGIRRVFGSPVKNLMIQIFSENFLFTLLGGLAGLLFSYILILISSDWIMTIGQGLVTLPADGGTVVFTPEMLINIPVFLIALGVCFILNILAAFIPAWRASHKEIIHSLNAKQF